MVCRRSRVICKYLSPRISGVFLFMEEFSFYRIGTVHCGGRYKFEAPRQGVYSSARAVIELDSQYAGDAVTDLAAFERIWVLFVFHCNLGKKWKPKTSPPYVPEMRKYSLFATRSPYRPNPIGLSCVKLDGIENQRNLIISGHDLLDGTPVLDIKPYIPHADAFPEAAAGWRDELVLPQWELDYSPLFCCQVEFLLALGAPDMFNFCQIQLVHTPLDASRRRLTEIAPDEYELGCRTWRIGFRIFPDTFRIEVRYVRSNYSAAELQPDSMDKYGDKELHRAFLVKFPG